MSSTNRTRASWRSQRWPALLAVALSLCAQRALAQEAGTAVYTRVDSDQTTVIAPRLHASAPAGDGTRVDVVYTMDIWTSASVDIRASASKPITEQRDEMHLRLAHDWESMSLSGGYRYSKEPDYESHGGSIGFSRDFADKAATAALELSATFDTVGRAGDPGFARTARTLSARASFTQILDPDTLVQVIYDPGLQQGYLSSPYRRVGIGSADGYCSAGYTFCVPETNPNSRLRHAAALRARRAFGKQLSLGLGYRFYIDDWKLLSHTVNAEVAFLPEPDTVLALRYRFYLQGPADQYRSHYDSEDLRYYTNDKELSPFSSHRVALDLEHAFRFDDPSERLRVMLSVAPSLFMYSDFVRLSRIQALEVTLATVFQL